MQVSVQDTINIQQVDTLKTIKPDYYLGSYIPVDSSGSSFPDTLITSDYSFARIFTEYNRPFGDAMSRGSLNSDFCFALLSISLVLLAVLTILGRKQLFNTLSSLSLKRPYVTPSHGSLGILSWTPVFATLFAFLNVSLFIVIAGVTLELFGDLRGIATAQYIGIVFASSVAALFIRHIICIFSGSLSGHKNAFSEYRAVIESMWFLSGFVLFLSSIAVLYSPYNHPEHIILAGAGAVVLLYFYRIIRLLIIFLKQRISILYFILYLCALEVLPVLIGLKLLRLF